MAPPPFAPCLDLLPIGACIIDQSHRVRLWNQRLEQWTGIPASQIVGGALGRHFPHLEEARYRPRLDSVLRTGAPMVFSSQWHKHFFPAQRPDGTPQIQHTTASAFADPESGEFLALLAVQDVSDMAQRIRDHRSALKSAVAEVEERRCTEEKLRDRARQQGIVSQLGHLALTQARPADLIPRATNLAAEAMGVDLCQVFLTDPDQEGDLILADPGDACATTRISAAVRSQAGRALETELPQVVADIRSSHIYSQGYPYPGAQFHSGICVAIPSKDRPLGVLCFHARAPRKYDREDLHFCKAVANILGEAFEIERSDLALRRFTDDLLVAKRELEEQAVDLRQKGVELDEARQAADRANQSKSSYLARMSHEIRTPMNAILGFTELLADESTEAEHRRDFLRTIESNGRHLIELLNDILDLSKIEAGGMELESLALDPEALGAEVVSMLRASAENKGLKLYLEVAEGVPPQIQGDPTRLRQVLVNLVGNAVKFTAEGSVRLELSRTAPRGGTGPWLRFSVIDTGIGMDQAALDRLFQPFCQGTEQTSREYGGTGLGMAISRHLAECMGGELLASSRAAQGSRFDLCLPATPAPPAAGDAPSPGLAASPRKSSGNRILLAEDRPDNQRLISLILRKEGFEVSLATDGAEAVSQSLAAQEAGDPFALILMDMQMPVLDGVEATSRIRAGGIEQPIVALTANALSEDRERCLAAGCDDFCTKPISRRDLVAVVKGQLSGR